MQTTIEFLDALKASNNGASDYQISKLLGVSQQTVSKWRVGKSFMGDSTAIRAAKLLGIDPAYVIACAHSEIAREDDEKAIWQGLAARLTPRDGAGTFCIMLSHKPRISPGLLSVFGTAQNLPF